MKFATTTGDFASYCDNDTRRRHALIDVGFGGYFTLECGSSIIKRKYRLGNRRPFDKDTRLADPPRFIQECLEAASYEAAKYLLESYGLFAE